jgi:hypothetical protein
LSVLTVSIRRLVFLLDARVSIVCFMKNTKRKGYDPIYRVHLSHTFVLHISNQDLDSQRHMLWVMLMTITVQTYTKRVIRKHKLKNDRQYNCQQKDEQRSTKQYTKKPRRSGKANITKSRKGRQFLLYMLKYHSQLFITVSRFIFRYNFNT